MTESLAEKVAWLFENVPDPQTGEFFTTPRLAARIRLLRPGFSITGTAIWNVRAGITARPSWQLIEGMAKAFGVPPSFFSDDVAIRDLEQQRAVADILNDERVRSLAQRAFGVSPESLRVVATILERCRELEGLNRSARADEGALAHWSTSATGRPW